MRVLAILITLPPEHLKTLENFYATQTAVSKRKALVEAFAAENEAAVRRAFLRYYQPQPVSFTAAQRREILRIVKDHVKAHR